MDDREAAFQDLYGPWRPFTPRVLGELFAEARFRWWIGGGWALELESAARRRHADIDVVVLHAELDAVREHLAQFHLWEAHDGTLRPLPPGCELTPDREQLWMRRRATEPWLADILLTPSVDGRWMFKKDARISLPLGDVGVVRNGLPFLRPEVALLHKAHLARPRDEADFAAVLPWLDERARTWLDDALATYRPEHPWRERLAGRGRERPSPDIVG
jgi:hypothetical protein